MKNPAIYSLAAVLLFVFACKKNDANKNANNTTTSSPKLITAKAINIINPNDVPVVFCWDDTIGRVCSGHKYIDSVVVAPNDTVNIPTSRFSCGVFGCAAWYYSYDMSINNWYNSRSYQYNYLWFGGDSNSKIIIQITDTANVYLQHAGGNWYNGSRKWYAADAYNAAGASVWNTLSAADKMQALELTYGSVFSYRGYKSGVSDSAWFNYPILAAPPAFKIEMKNNLYAKSTISQLYLTDKLPTTTAVSSPAADTLFMVINGTPPYYKMYRMP